MNALHNLFDSIVAQDQEWLEQLLDTQVIEEPELWAGVGMALGAPTPLMAQSLLQRLTQSVSFSSFVLHHAQHSVGRPWIIEVLAPFLEKSHITADMLWTIRGMSCFTELLEKTHPDHVIRLHVKAVMEGDRALNALLAKFQPDHTQLFLPLRECVAKHQLDMAEDLMAYLEPIEMARYCLDGSLWVPSELLADVARFGIAHFLINKDFLSISKTPRSGKNSKPNTSVARITPFVFKQTNIEETDRYALCLWAVLQHEEKSLKRLLTQETAQRDNCFLLSAACLLGHTDLAKMLLVYAQPTGPCWALRNAVWGQNEEMTQVLLPFCHQSIDGSFLFQCLVNDTPEIGIALMNYCDPSQTMTHLQKLGHTKAETLREWTAQWQRQKLSLALGLDQNTEEGDATGRGRRKI